jgi:hypothetical protein
MYVAIVSRFFVKVIRMKKHGPAPGVSRDNRISDDGLERLNKQLDRGVKISQPVLLQWIKRYGEAARTIIEQHGIKIRE